MRTFDYFKALLSMLLATLALATSMNAAAVVPTTASTSMTLQPLSLNNVDDAAGRWQHEGGRVMQGTSQIGNYAAHRRVTFSGTSPQNTAMLTITIFFNSTAGTPPQNITIQGSHDFSSGRYIGSVSAASSSYKLWIGANVSGSTSTNTLTLSKP